MSAAFKVLAVVLAGGAFAAATGLDHGRISAILRELIAGRAAAAAPMNGMLAGAGMPSTMPGGVLRMPNAMPQAARNAGANEPIARGIPVASPEALNAGVPVVAAESIAAGVPVVGATNPPQGVPVVSALSAPATLGAASLGPASLGAPSVGAASLGAAPSQPSWPPATANSAPDPLAHWGRPANPKLDPRRFTEAHWQGIEVVPNTPTLAKTLGIDPQRQGVIADDVSLPADLNGFMAGDLIVAIGDMPTPDLLAFVLASDIVRDAQQVPLRIVRKGKELTLTLSALLDRLGNANGETPPMIPSGARMPHAYRGPCTNCHRIGTTGNLVADQGDPMIKTAPPISANATRPHEDRGPCTACHTITP